MAAVPIGRLLIGVSDAQHSRLGHRRRGDLQRQRQSLGAAKPAWDRECGQAATLNGVVMLGELTSRSGWFGSAESATLSAPAVKSASNRFSSRAQRGARHSGVRGLAWRP
jgi:hypothetical protein